MKKLLVLIAVGSMAGLCQASLAPGDSLSPYEIKNADTGKEYCQVCAYSGKAGKIVAFGKLNDEKFWADLKILQRLHESQKNLGVFAQIIDSKDSKAIKAAAARHGITFPIVTPVKTDWDKAYKVEGVSRTIYYAKKNNKIVWTSVGLDNAAAGELEAKVKTDLAS